MAVSATHYIIVRDLYRHGLLPRGGALLEIGEANWYGDVRPLAMIDDIKRFITEPTRRDALVRRLTEIVERDDRATPFDVVKVFYDLYFAPANIQAVDPGGTDAAHNFDLNYPITLDRRFDTVVNHGTAEHVFNVAQVFKTIHDYTLPGGLMIHESPFIGWIEHGFYNLQPLVFADVAQANAYELVGMIAADIGTKTSWQIQSLPHVNELVHGGQLPDNSVLFTILRKGPADAPFVMPRQDPARYGAA